MAFCPFTILLPIVCGLIAGSPQPVITEHNTLFMRQEALNLGFAFSIFAHHYSCKLKETLTQSRGCQGKAGDGEDGEGHDVDECVMNLTDVSVGRLSWFLYHLRDLIYLRCDGGPSHQIQ